MSHKDDYPIPWTTLFPSSGGQNKPMKPASIHDRALPAERTDCSMTMMKLPAFTVKNPDTEQIGGKHYTKCAIQPWDYVIANELDYFQGSIIKYVTRWRDKGWTEDLHKAKHFLDKYIVTMEEKYPHLKERPDDGTPNPHS